MSVPRVLATEAALTLLERLKARHGPLMFHQSGGCCDGSAPMCFPLGEFRVGGADVLLGELGGCPFYIGGQQAPLWAHTQLIIDAVPGRGAGFSLEAPEGQRFLTRSRVFGQAGNAIVALDRATGALQWRQPLPRGTVARSLAASRDHLFASFNDLLAAYRLDDGRLEWVQPMPMGGVLSLANGLVLLANRVPQPELVARMQDAARWSETNGCHGMLVYTDNGLVDPWLAAEVLLAATARLVPLIAVQSVYLHPYSAAKLIASCAHLRQRRLDVNLVAGGFTNDLRALGDRTPHDQRYDRTVEFARILRGLVDGEAVSLQGQWWQVETLRLTPECVRPSTRPISVPRTPKQFTATKLTTPRASATLRFVLRVSTRARVRPY